VRGACVARLAGAVLLAAACGLGCRAGGSEEPGKPAPAWTLEDLKGGQVSLADLRGRPVVLDFWATWCTPCEFQIPILNQLHEKYGDRVEVVGIAVDAGGRETVAPFAAERKIGYRVLLGDEALAQRYGAIGFPALYVLRPDGTVASSHLGLVDPGDLEDAVEAALASPAAPPAG
jgi:thiol-disulfide isomerase/thioredoxin